MTNKQIENNIQNFDNFMFTAFEHLRLPPPTRMQLYVARFLIEGHKRMQLHTLRGLGKTLILGIFVCWRLLRNPNEKILIVSQSGGHSEAIAIFIKKLIHTMPLLSHLKATSNQRDTTTAFEVAGCEITVQPSVKSLGITSQLQGNRATLLIADDVEGVQNSMTEVRREQLLAQMAEFEAILTTNDESQIIIVGTPQSSESVYNKLRDRGYVTRFYPARYPEKVANYEGCLADYIVEDIENNPELINTPIDSRFTEIDLIQRELSYGISGFKLQFMLDTKLSDDEKYPLKLRDLIITDLEATVAPTSISWSSASDTIINGIPNVGFTGDRLHRPNTTSSEVIPYEGTVLAIDPSGRGKDETGIAVVNHLHGKIFIPYFTGLTGGYDETLIRIAEVAKEYEVESIVIESNFGDGLYGNVLQPILDAIYPCTIEEIRSNIQKEKRIIDTLEPLFNQHRIVVDYSAMEKDVSEALNTDTNKLLAYSMCYQMTHITKVKGSITHDDRLDAITLGIQYWNERNILNQNSSLAVAQYQKKLFDKEVTRRADIFKKMNRSKPKSSNALASTMGSFR